MDEMETFIMQLDQKRVELVISKLSKVLLDLDANPIEAHLALSHIKGMIEQKCFICAQEIVVDSGEVH